MRKDLYKLFKTLGNKKRLKIVELLLKNTGLSVEAISRRIDSSYKSTSKHLLILENAGLVERKQSKWWGFYSISTGNKDFIRRILSVANKIK